MHVERLRVRGYRSLRSVDLRLGRCTIVVGANGTGKTNLYRAMQLVSRAADGRLGRGIAEEGGMASVRWAGPRRKGETGLSIEIELDDLTYALTLALPNPYGVGFATRFVLDPHVGEESLSVGAGRRRVRILERGGSSCFVHDADGRRVVFPAELVESESVLAQISDPRAYPVLAAIRALFLRYRFYHHFRTDPAAPMREPRVGTRTPILGDDGADLASAIVTIEEIGDADAFARWVAAAFAGARVEVASTDDGRFVVTLATPGIARPLAARELSDGTLRYLALLAALSSPHPAPLLVLNEPETSLHPELLAALVDPIAAACERSQVVVLTHAHAFADALAAKTSARRIALTKAQGETVLA